MRPHFAQVREGIAAGEPTLHKLATVLALAALLVMGSARAQSDPNSYPDPYRMVESWAQLPTGRKLGQVIGVQVDPDGKSIWAFDRCGGSGCMGSGLAPIFEFDASGGMTRNFGAGLFLVPHGFAVDRDGHVWTTDAGGKDGKGQQAIEFDRTGRELRRLGTAGVSGETSTTFFSPTAVTIASDGAVFVADGHVNSRIVKFDKDGHYVKAWGRKGRGPGEFNTPHALAIDSQGRLFVADRGNNRLQIFNEDGGFVDEWRQFGRPSGIFIGPDDTIYVADSDSTDKTNPGFKQGIRIGSARDGVVRFFIPTEGDGPAEINGRGTSTEGVAADAAGNVFGGETANGQTLRKYVKE